MIPPTTPHAPREIGRPHASSRSTLADTADRASGLLKEAGIASHRLDARLITAFVLGLSETDVIRVPDRPITRREQERVDSLIERRSAGVPTAYIIGKKEFWSLTILVDERVLVPRPETELLVVETIAAARGLNRGDPRIVEIGTGSGAVACALSMELGGARIVSIDISADAISVARANFTAHGVKDRIEVRRGDLYGALAPGETFDVIVSNPPYLTAREIDEGPAEIRSEPRVALFGGEEGLSVIERLIAGAPTHLVPGGYLIIEIGARQKDAVSGIMEKTPGLTFSHISRDLAGLPRAAVARRSRSEVLSCSKR